LEYRQLGYTGLRVSELALGTMTSGGQGKFEYVGRTEVDEARQIVDRALDAGVNFIDTADVYSDGRAEEIVGETMKGRRDQIVLATKARFAMGSGPNDAGCHGDTCYGRVRRVCAAFKRTTSTCTRSTSGMDSPRWKRPSTPSTPSSTRERFATSGARTTLRGTS
jgi:aryl-alcohol dehydrogenase-like predicted oxidoreductase